MKPKSFHTVARRRPVTTAVVFAPETSKTELERLSKHLHDTNLGFVTVDNNVMTLDLGGKKTRLVSGQVAVINNGTVVGVMSQEAFDSEYEILEDDFDMDEIREIVELHRKTKQTVTPAAVADASADEPETAEVAKTTRAKTAAKTTTEK